MNRSNNSFSLWLIALTAAGIVSSAGADAIPTWELLPEAKVDSSGIYLSEVVTSRNATLVLPQIRLAPAPGLGQAVSFSRSQLTELVQKYESSGLITTNWSGAQQIRVSRRTRQLVDTELTDLLAATLQRENVRDKGQIELHLSRPFAPVLVPDEPLTVKLLELPATGVNASFVVRFEIWNAKEHVGSWQLPVLANVWRDVPVAHTALVRGQLLRDADITLERHDVLALREALQNYPNPEGTLELSENIAAGMPLLNRSVRQRPVIQRGRLVEAVYQDGSLSISLKVETLEDGLPGQIVRVRNPKTRRELYGKVQNEQTILINL